MSRIDDLIAERCPDGVRHSPLGDLADLKRGETITKEVANADGKIPVVAGGRTAAYYHDANNRSGPVIVIAGSGAYAGFVSWWDDPIWVSDAFSVIPKTDKLERRFIFHLLLEKQNWLHSLKSGGGVPHVYPKDVANLKVPVPPLEVQREIVRILDHFTELEAELGAELEARHKQYEHYRNELLTFTEDEVRWVPMGELLRIRNGRDYKHLGKGNVPVFGSGGIMAYVDQHLTANPTVLIPRKGSLGNLYYVDQPVWTVDTIFYTEIDAENLQPKYLFHFLKTQDLAGMNQAGGVPSLTQSMLSKLVVPLPAMGRQQEIVDILEKFEAFVNDISGGLPAEIEARRKQYEYYRGKLLTFAEVAS